MRVISVSAARCGSLENETDELVSDSCSSLSNVDDARAVCDLLGITHHVFDFRDEFKKSVIDDFISVYETGRTRIPVSNATDFEIRAAL